MQATSLKNSAGFTLVEVMVAILIMMVGMLGLLEIINVSMQYNLKNQLRDEAVHVGEWYMTQLRGQPFDTSDQFKTYTTSTYTSKIRGVNKSYSVERTSSPLALDSNNQATSRQLTVTVKWGFRNQSSLNRVVSVVPRP